jgi:D-alanyl-lipoteichoic acid acyltransferase DltB (MBOAT superfamily)
MLFNSFEFLLFFPVVFLLYWYVFGRNLKAQNVLVLVASYFFYGWWSWKFLGLLVLSTVLDYLYGFWVASPNRKKARLFLWLSIVNNLGILAVFKYYNFFAQQFQLGCEHLGLSIHPLLLSVGLPIGISFYTFHGMSYVFDIYRGQQKPVRNFPEYAVFVSFFPLLVAGPIERANHLLPQIQQPRIFDYNRAVQGCRLILWGLFKKVVIADSLALTVDEIFKNYPYHNGVTLITGAIAFSFQIYGDFSGYSDIAMGTAKLMGFELLSNFRFPYFSRDVAEFWRRWHISLSSWFRDYLYIPLGGSKSGKYKAVRNTFIIFLVSGFWHGASWNFIVWGFVHACGFLPLLLLNRNRQHVSDVVAQGHWFPNGKELLQMSTTFLFVSFAWVFFRAENLQAAVGYLRQIGQSIVSDPAQFLSLPGGKVVFLYIVPLVLGDWYLRENERVLRAGNRWVMLVVYMLLAGLIVYNFSADSNFIYFQF